MKDDFVIYVDFDSTLYNSRQFGDDFRVMLANETGLSSEQIKTDGASYFFHPNLGGYEFEKHIAKYGLDSADMWDELEGIIQGKNYLYPDSAAFMQSLQADGYTPKILTFGEKRFQLAKIMPTLKYLTDTGHPDIEVIVVDAKKNQHIAASHTGQRGVLIDDKPDQQLPSGFTEIHLKREEVLESPIFNGDVVVISSLQQARDVIDSLNMNP